MGSENGLLGEYKDELFNDQFALWINVAILWVLVSLVVISHVKHVGTATEATQIRNLLSWVAPLMATQPFWGAALGVVGKRARRVMSA